MPVLMLAMRIARTLAVERIWVLWRFDEDRIDVRLPRLVANTMLERPLRLLRPHSDYWREKGVRREEGVREEVRLWSRLPLVHSAGRADVRRTRPQNFTLTSTTSTLSPVQIASF